MNHRNHTDGPEGLPNSSRGRKPPVISANEHAPEGRKIQPRFFTKILKNPGHRIILTTLLVSLHARADTTNDWIKKGDAFDQRLENRPALDAYLAAEKIGPADAALLCKIAREYGALMADTNSVAQKRELGEKALGYANRAVALDGSSATAQLSVAVCYGRLAPLMDNKTKIAYSRQVKEHASKALALDPKNDLTYNVLGSWNYELAGLNPFLRALAGIIYGQIPSASYEEAVKNFRKALEINPDRLANHIGLGRALAAIGKTAEGKQEIEHGLNMADKEKDDPYVKAQGRDTLQKL